MNLARAPSSTWRWVWFVFSLILLHLVLVAPVEPNTLTPLALLRPTLELAALVILAAFAPEWLRRPLRWLVLTVLALLVLLKLADFGFFTAFDRPFDPVLDLYLLPAGWTLLSGTMGQAKALAAAAGGALGLIAITALLYGALRGLEALRPLPREHIKVGAVTAVLAILAVAPLGARFGPSGAPVLAMTVEHVATSARSLKDAKAFAQAIDDDPYRKVSDTALLSALRGKDVLLVFVESYGRGAIEDPRFAPVIQARLAKVEQEIGQSGFQARSAWLGSPTHGGQSWLAHETMLSGLWVDGGRRYDQLIRSRRSTLIGDFHRAGWRTVAVMPAISEAWPEGNFFGYDKIYAARDLGYRGLPFNWITMPDQYTLAAFRDRELVKPDRPPIMAEIALISSHAPFTPTPPLLDWKDIGDGHVYDRTVQGSETPDSLWRDMNRVGVAYAASIDYSLASMAAFIRDYGDDRLVVIALGDHQPGGAMTRDGGPHEVPIHLFAKDPKVLQTVSGWGWASGMRPDPAKPATPMNGFRARLLSSFTPGAPTSP